LIYLGKPVACDLLKKPVYQECTLGVYRFGGKKLDFPKNGINVQFKHDSLKIFIVEMVPQPLKKLMCSVKNHPFFGYSIERFMNSGLIQMLAKQNSIFKCQLFFVDTNRLPNKYG
jgi:hypothetical protein